MLAASATVAAFAVAAGPAGGVSGGTGAGGGKPAKINDVTCVKRCLDVRTVAETGRIEISGSRLRRTETVKFPTEGRRVAVEPRSVSGRAVTARVPAGAVDGKPSIVSTAGTRLRSRVEIEVVPESAITEPGEFAIREARAKPAKSYFHGTRDSRVDYLFEADGPTDIRIDVIRKKTGRVIDSIVERDQEPYAGHSAIWDGLQGRDVARNGDYRFRIAPLSGGAGARVGFSFFDHIFPLRAKHGYGDGLGAGRNHQGQDVFARCGAKMKAARGGRVQVNQYHSAAGYYVVVDGRKTGRDYVYMHMQKKGRPKVGERIRTGEVIGFNSDTGNASGCHLHFELWSAPGWYEGGRVLDPTPRLKKWDGWS